MTSISFGAILPIGRRLELRELPDASAKWATTVESARTAEALGYDSVWVYDHFHNVPEPSHETVFESWTDRVASPAGGRLSAEGLAALDTLARSMEGR